ncbi:MAG: aminopeptidase [Candidatus Marinimicrobia bacterium]|nr:aminopeptidase [Candidatus Neomarinimicrobiota bacterium]
MDKIISSKQINTYRKKFNSSLLYESSMNALTRSKLEDVSMDWETFRNIDHTYSNVITSEMKKVTNQKSSGRCWGFAALNLMRIELAKKYNLVDFEFSQSYFMFFDKLEKANYFLENILATLDRPSDGRLISWLVSSPIQDGGQWDMFVNLMEKYGIVPQSVMPERFHTSNSRSMNQLITRQLRKFASILRLENNKGTNLAKLRKMKLDMMEDIYNMLCMFIGKPPESFDWQIRDKKNKFLRFDNISPIDFYKNNVGINLKDKVCLIHCPMDTKNFNELYTIKYLGNVIEGQIIKYLNINIDDMKKYAIKSLKNDEPVWFGCDVGKMFHRDLGVMDMNLYNYKLTFGVDSNMDKATRLEYGDSQMTHAMLFTGVDIKSNKSTKWRVENSWGVKGGCKGYYLMTDQWFDQYNYEVVVDKKYLPEKVRKLFNKKPTFLNPWDPMGALAK